MTVDWHRGHYNAIAKDIRSEFPMDDAYNDSDRTLRNMITRTTLCDLAVRLAVRFKKYDPEFNVFEWLDLCSPDPIMYPISELYEDIKRDIEHRMETDG